MRPPIYKPTGAAKEYGDLAINIYTGCPHRCFYCFAPSVLRKDRETFHSVVEPRPNIVEETRRQIEREHITGKLIHLCFTCDPYPSGFDTTPTRDIIKLLKKTGNHVQILTKGDGSRDFDLLDEHDWYGITFDGDLVNAINNAAIAQLKMAHLKDIKTWVSFEPVINAENVLSEISLVGGTGIVDKVKIGKLNYHPSDIDWKQFGIKAEKLCRDLGLNYAIKDSLRKEMKK